MEPNPSKPLRQVAIADHLWEAFDLMAAEMGSDRAALINQAMHMFARLNGYLVPGAAARPAAAVAQAAGAAPRAAAPLDDPGRREAAAKGLEPDIRERLASQRGTAAPGGASATGSSTPRKLSLLREGATALPVAKDRFVIGRGKHCDLVIESGKVSREHAVIVRDGADWFIEDLGSSNGTWFDKERIERRRIQDGDEYFICSEQIRCVLR